MPIRCKTAAGPKPGLIAGALGAALLLGPAVAGAGSLQNLERERAVLVSALLDPEAGPAERAARIETSQRRLVNLERIVMRDEALVGRNTPNVRRAFANYDLTFLVHSAGERELTVTEVWLEQVGVSTERLMATRKARR